MYSNIFNNHFKKGPEDFILGVALWAGLFSITPRYSAG